MKVSAVISHAFAFFPLLFASDVQTPVGAAQAEMVRTATEFLNFLDEDQRTSAFVPFGDEERFNWYYTPRQRKGLSLKRMTGPQKKAAHALFQSGLSAKGYTKATGVMALEQVLRELEGDFRDPEMYYVTIFGTPSEKEAWGWRVEGHHLSVNFSSATNELVATTPSFFGSNPAHVASGPRRGEQVLKIEEDLGRELVLSLDSAQRSRAILAVRAPADIVTGNSRRIDVGKPQGLAVYAMTADQRAMLMRLVEEYVNNVRVEFADAYLARIGKAGIEKIHFAWAGGTSPGQGHYYRIHGPTFLIEYDNTQDDANHIHTVWRDLENDFGVDLLRKHYEESPHHRNN